MTEPTDLHSTKRHAPLVVELAGLAGAGKTTLLCALAEQDARFKIVSDLEIRNREHLPIFAGHARFMLSLMRHQSHCDRRFTWDEMKAMIYLQRWPHLLKAHPMQGAQAILLNHGPVFKLATLFGFGPETLKSQRFEPWWHLVYEQWACTLDLIVWLKAPEKILIRRINARSQRHAVKDKSEAEAQSFLARYQNAYEEVLKQLVAHGAPMPLVFDSSEVSVEWLVSEVVRSCRVKLGEA